MENKLVEALQLIQNYADERKEMSFGMEYIFDTCTETLTEFELARSAPETTASPSETAADKGILTEEELNKIHKELDNYMPDVRTAEMLESVIKSHRNLLSANAELSFKNDKLIKKISTTMERLESIENEFYHEPIRELERCRSQAKYAREELK